MLLLDSLKILAVVDNPKKQIILEVYRNNQNIADLYVDGCQHRIRKISEIGDPSLEMAYRGYLSTFYDPLFYDGYPISDAGVASDFDRKNSQNFPAIQVTLCQSEKAVMVVPEREKNRH